MLASPRMKIAAIIICSLMIVPSANAGIWGQLHQEDSDFFTLSYGEQEKTIRLYPIHKQLRLYMYGMTQNRPIAYHLLGPVASTGKEIIPSTLAMLELVDSDEELSAVLALLLQIDQDYYHWRIDKYLIDLARQKTSLVRKQEWQQRVLDILGRERK